MTIVNRASRVFIALLGMAVLGWAAYEAGRRGLADWVSLRARFQVASWAQKRTVPSQEQWQRAVDALGAAQKLAPEDPSLHDHLGAAYELASAALDPKGQWNVYTEFALLHFQQAAARRPTSPYSWASIATMKYRLGRIDEELSRRLPCPCARGPGNRRCKSRCRIWGSRSGTGSTRTKRGRSAKTGAGLRSGRPTSLPSWPLHEIASIYCAKRHLTP